MSLSRWDPFDEILSLRDAMDQLFEQSFVRPRRQSGENGSRLYKLPVDVYETPDEFVVEAVVPGIPVEHVDIEFDNGTLTITGEIPVREADSVTYYLRERWHGRFRRVLSLPGTIDADAIEATAENGVLSVYLPKVEEAKPRHIPVTTRS